MQPVIRVSLLVRGPGNQDVGRGEIGIGGAAAAALAAVVTGGAAVVDLGENGEPAGMQVTLSWSAACFTSNS
jgi:hypothetical protein